MNIEKNIQIFIGGEGKNKGRKPNERYASFDYCFNYFQSFREKGCIKDLSNDENIQLSCLHLAFYLASWGMLRGSSALLEKSLGHYKDLIINISQFDEKIWDIDIDVYTQENVSLLLECKRMIIDSLDKASDTLVTKIMLGVYANVPAFDANFCKGFKINKFEKKSLLLLSQFYKENKDLIDKYDIYTFDFTTGKETKRKYTKAKIIDMIGFIEGEKK